MPSCAVLTPGVRSFCSHLSAALFQAWVRRGGEFPRLADGKTYTGQFFQITRDTTVDPMHSLCAALAKASVTLGGRDYARFTPYCHESRRHAGTESAAHPGRR